MDVVRNETFALACELDVVRARQAVRAYAIELGFKLVDQTKVVTAASELARNSLIYAGGGTVILTSLRNGTRKGIRMEFVDQGPGIPDIAMAMRDGYTTGSGMGMGLGGARRLVSEFQIESQVGVGTRIVATKWI